MFKLGTFSWSFVSGRLDSLVYIGVHWIKADLITGEQPFSGNEADQAQKWKNIAYQTILRST